MSEEITDEGGVGGGGVGEERVAPRREEREVEVDYGSEAGWEHEEVTSVGAESEGRAGGSFEVEPFPADEGGGVAGADVGDGGDYVGEDYIGEVVNGGVSHE